MPVILTLWRSFIPYWDFKTNLSIWDTLSNVCYVFLYLSMAFIWHNILELLSTAQLVVLIMDSSPTSIMIIYDSTWSILIQWIRVMIVGWHSDQVNTKESILPFCDKPYHTNKRRVQIGEGIEALQNCAFTDILVTVSATSLLAAVILCLWVFIYRNFSVNGNLFWRSYVTI